MDISSIVKYCHWSVDLLYLSNQEKITASLITEFFALTGRLCNEVEPKYNQIHIRFENVTK